MLCRAPWISWTNRPVRLPPGVKQTCQSGPAAGAGRGTDLAGAQRGNGDYRHVQQAATKITSYDYP